MPNILVLDDDEHFRQYLAALLRRAGYGVHAPSQGRETHAALDAGRFDAVVTDLYMPDADGIEVVRRVKRHFPNTPVIGITGGPLGFDDPCSKAMSVLGADAVLTKPLDSAEFLRILCSAIEGARQRSVTQSPGQGRNP